MSSVGITLLLALAAASEPDPRPTLVQLQLEDRHLEALQETRREIRDHPDEARALGLHYLRGHLLDHLGRHEQAADAFAQAMGEDSRLALYSRYRAALKHEELGHPETAAGVVATVINADDVPLDLRRRAIRLLSHTLLAGGDCRVLNVKPDRLSSEESRYVRLARAHCAERQGSHVEARRLYLGLLEEEVPDEAQWEAAVRLARLVPSRAAPLDPRNPDRSVAALLGMAFYQHREFDAAHRYLTRTALIYGDSLSEEEFELAYARARSLFWQEEHDRAALEYQWLARQAPEAELQARAFYQAARSFELSGRWRQAHGAFRAAFRADPDSRWADAALFSLLRLLWRGEQEEEGQMLYEHLLTRRSWRRTAARASLFLAASDLVRERTDRAGAWLDRAARVPEARLEVDYWRGRLAELENRPEAAVDAYLSVLRRDLFHPLATEARRRLGGSNLARLVHLRGVNASRSDDNDRLYEAWLLLGPRHPSGQGALDHLRRHLAEDRSSAPFLELQPLPVPRWPLWQNSLRGPEEMLLALGDFQQTAHVVDEHFPLNDLELGFTGSNLLAIAGQTRDSIRLAEILAQRVPDDLPEPLLPAGYRRLLHPLAHRDLLISESRRYGIDPLLLAALIREESRFDPQALSAASARGLTQFVQPTARRLATRIGFADLRPRDIYRPRVAIALGAAYLQELAQRFPEAPEQVVAAYNAGEPQAELWRTYCVSSEPAEYFTKVGFRETRNYLGRVLGSYARYRDLYGSLEILVAPQESPALP